MSDWTADQLGTADRVDEVEISTDRPDGTSRAAVPIWIVRVGDGVFVRSYRGDRGAWYRHARATGAGRIQLAGVTFAVTFHPVTDGEVSASIDDAYRAKYARYGDSYLKPMVAEAAQATTLRLTLRHNETN